MKNYHLIFMFVCLSSSVWLLGCAGGDMFIKADRLDYPVSTTQGIFDRSYNLLSEDNFSVIDTVDFKVSKYYILWTAIPLGKDPDISEQLNIAIKRKKGDGIINLKVSIIEDWSPMSIITWLASGIPILPSWVQARITGDVVKQRK